VRVPPVLGVTTRSTVGAAPGARSPKSQVTVPFDCEQLPVDGVAETNVLPVGTGIVRREPYAVAAPVFVTVKWYVALPEPSSSTDGLAVAVAARFVCW
jgi:hypothetical protein